MNLARFLGWVAAGTVAALLYTMQQVALVRAGYRLDQAALRVDAARNELEHLQHQVLALKSPAQLEARLASLDVELAPVGREQIVRVSVPWTGAAAAAPAHQLAWWRVLSGAPPAEAQGE